MRNLCQYPHPEKIGSQEWLGTLISRLKKYNQFVFDHHKDPEYVKSVESHLWYIDAILWDLQDWHKSIGESQPPFLHEPGKAF